MTSLGDPITGPDGKPYVPVKVGQSRPFALAVLAEWQAIDGTNRGWMFRQNAFNVPKDVMDEILPRVRARLQRQGEAN